MVKKKFRTLYDPGDYNDSSLGGGDSMTDSSNYVSTEELITRFTKGEIIAGSGKGMYEVQEGEPDDITFENDAQQKKLDKELSLLGEEAIANKLKTIRAKLKSERLKKESEIRAKPALPGEEIVTQSQDGKPPKGASASPEAK